MKRYFVARDHFNVIYLSSSRSHSALEFLKWQAEQAEIALKYPERCIKRLTQYHIRQLHMAINKYRKALSLQAAESAAEASSGVAGKSVPLRRSSRQKKVSKKQ
jgi:hypothetical protein